RDAERVDGRVLGQPQLVRSVGAAAAGELLHRAPGRLVVRPVESAHAGGSGGGGIDFRGDDAHRFSCSIIRTLGQCRNSPKISLAELMRTTLSIVVAALLVVASGSRAADQETENYVASLSRVYDHTLWIRAVKEGCDSEDKKTAGANSVAYNSWRRRNSALLDELERRFLVLVHGASIDQKDYTKNVGKYMGEVVQ